MVRVISGSDNMKEKVTARKELKELKVKVGMGHPHECGRYQRYQ